jgi:hypothetical protein
MKKKHENRKIVLNRETLRQLTEPELQNAEGGQKPPTGPTCSGHLPCTC